MFVVHVTPGGRHEHPVQGPALSPDVYMSWSV